MSQATGTEANCVTLARLLPGESGLVRAFQGNSDIEYRLRELGVIEGTRIYVKRLAPLGDPMELVVRGYSLSLRKKDAAHILIRKLSDAHHA